MSERQSNSAGRLDNWDNNKKAHEQEEWENSLYDEAGKTDFSDEARTRAEEADVYERHMADMLDNDGAVETDQLDAIDRTIASDPRLRRMAGMAHNIAELASRQPGENDDADRMMEALKDKEDKLEELLLEYQKDGSAHEYEKEEIFNRIIEMSRTAPVATEVMGDEETAEAPVGTSEQPAEGEPSEPKFDPEAELAAARQRVSDAAGEKADAYTDKLDKDGEADREAIAKPVLQPVELPGETNDDKKPVLEPVELPSESTNTDKPKLSPVKLPGEGSAEAEKPVLEPVELPGESEDSEEVINDSTVEQDAEPQKESLRDRARRSFFALQTRAAELKDKVLAKGQGEEQEQKRRRNLIIGGAVGAVGLLAATYAASKGFDTPKGHGTLEAGSDAQSVAPLPSAETSGTGNGGASHTAAEFFGGKGGSTEFSADGVRDFNDWLTHDGEGYTVKKGDSIWKLSEKYLEAKGIDNPSVYQTDAVKDQVLQDLQRRGVVGNDGFLKTGDIINISK